jgi:DNA-cytosine methyltransferase
MNVLSLFDGISCGQIALNRACIQYDNYYSSEIDQNAIKITQANYKNTIQLGDVVNIKSENLPKIDLIIGGSPCQGFSQAGKKLNFKDPRSKLFFEFVRLLKEINPRYFLLENVKLNKNSREIITNCLGVQPIEINSNLVSAQNRSRYYWTNIPNVTKPIDKKIVLGDIIDLSLTRKWVDKTKIKRSKITKNYLQYDLSGKWHKSQDQRAYFLDKKHGTVPSSRTKSKVKFISKKEEIGFILPSEIEKLQTVPIGYTDQNLSDNIRMSALGNGWTIDVIAHILSNIKKGGAL